MANTAMVEDRRVLVRRAFFLEYATLAWMTIEAGVAIISGIAAHSITLLAFGIDSLIELGLGGCADLATHGRAAARPVLRGIRRTRGKSYRRGTPVRSCGLYRGGRRMEPLDTTRASLFVVGIAYQRCGHTGHVGFVEAQAAHRRRAWQPRITHRRHRKHHLRLALARRGDWTSGAARARRMVGRFSSLTRDCVAAGQGRPRSFGGVTTAARELACRDWPKPSWAGRRFCGWDVVALIDMAASMD